MIRRWIFKILNEALEAHLISFHRNLEDDFNVRFQIIQQGIEQLATMLGEVHRALHRGDDVPQQEQVAIPNSRPSWPRMKRHLEERDVRKIIMEQQNSADFVAARNIASQMSEEAARLEAYWKHKSARVPENQD